MALVIEMPPGCGAADITRLIRRLAPARDFPGEDLVLDLRGVADVAPLPLVMLLAQARWLARDGQRRLGILSPGHEVACPPSTVDWEEVSVRPGGWTAPLLRRFGDSLGAAVAPVLPTTRTAVVGAQIARDALTGTGRGGDVEQLMEYVVGELMKNIQQHSRGHGFIMARYQPEEGLFSVAAADDGIGIRASYLTSLSPRAKGRERLDDAAWLDEALVLESSSKTHLSSPFGEPSVNRGVGLTISRAFARECLGDFILISGSGLLHHRFGDVANPCEAPASAMEAAYAGTACHLTFNLSAFGQVSYQEFRRSVLRDLGLLDAGGDLTVSEDCLIT